MPRIVPVELHQTDAKTAATLKAVKAKLGILPNLITTLARAPAALNGYLQFSEALGHGRLTSRQREMIAIALGALIFNFLYWSFGFLRMGTTGFTAQADGAGDTAEVRAILGRALLIAVASGLGLTLLQRPIATVALMLLGASTPVEILARDYLTIRIWAAPASLALYALMGTMIGLGQSGKLLRVQFVLNGLNMLLDMLFAGLGCWVGVYPVSPQVRRLPNGSRCCTRAG
jgi:MATE family multidrug resistance protein